MNKQIVDVNILGEIVRADTDGFVNLNTLALAGNQWRLNNGMAIYQLSAFLSSKCLSQYIEAASRIWNRPATAFLKKGGSGKSSHTLGHVSVAVLLAEQFSPDFHAAVHKVFIDGRLLENRLYGGEEYKRVNRAIDNFLPSPRGDNTGRYIQVSVAIRAKCELKKPDDADISTWNQKAADSVAQAKRVKMLEFLAGMVEIGAIRDWEQMKEILAKL